MKLATVSQASSGTQRVSAKREGLNRLVFFLLYFGLIVVIGIVVSKIPEASAALGLFSIAAVGFLFALRLKNIGHHPGFALLILVPLANAILLIYCLSIPPGYRETKKLDRAARIILGILLSLVAIIITLIVLAVGGYI